MKAYLSPAALTHGISTADFPLFTNIDFGGLQIFGVDVCIDWRRCSLIRGVYNDLVNES